MWKSKKKKKKILYLKWLNPIFQTTTLKWLMIKVRKLTHFHQSFWQKKIPLIFNKTIKMSYFSWNTDIYIFEEKVLTGEYRYPIIWMITGEWTNDMFILYCYCPVDLFRSSQFALSRHNTSSLINTRHHQANRSL